MMNKNRFSESYPKIGIRPTIDGRQGPLKVRDSLEEQTMDMAKSAANLLRENIRYSNGEPIEVVIADSTIARVPEAAACTEKFRKEGVDITLTVTPCWCYGSETMDMDPHTIKAVWGFNGSERPGAVYLAAVLAAHGQKGLPAFGIYGHEVQDADDTSVPEDVKEKILRFGRAAIAAATMRGKSYLQIGSMSMGIVGSAMDYDFMEEYLGMRVESIDEIEILRRIKEEIYDEETLQKAIEWTKEYAVEGIDQNPEDFQKSQEEKDKDWEFSIKTAVIIQDLMNGNEKISSKFEEESLGHNAIAAGFQGQRQWTDHWPNADFAEAILNSSFDWEGVREPFVLATENDILNGVGMVFNKLLTNKPQLFADVRTFWSKDAVKRVTNYDLDGKAKESDGLLLLLNSGSAAVDYAGESRDENGDKVVKAFYDVNQEDVKENMKATTWCAADYGYFRGGGFSSNFTTRMEMPLTMIRLNLVKGIGPVLQLVEGWSVNLPEEVSDTLMKRSDYTWPTTWFAPRTTQNENFKTAYDVMNNWGSNHGAISHGHIGSDVLTLCSMLRIPVSMHNVPESEIFRPHSWSAFGMDKEGSDFRACQAYGPLYKSIR